MAFDGRGDTCIPFQQVPYFNKFLQNHQVTITNIHTKIYFEDSHNDVRSIGVGSKPS